MNVNNIWTIFHLLHQHPRIGNSNLLKRACDVEQKMVGPSYCHIDAK